MADAIEYQGLQLAATLSSVADSMRNCANMADAFANVLKQASGNGSTHQAAFDAAKGGKRKAAAAGEDGTGEGAKRKRRKQPKDPNAPKRPASSYILFQNEIRKKMKESNPGMSNAELVASISKQWQTMTDEDKAVYNQATADAKERYSADKKAYDNRTPEEVAAQDRAAAAALAAKKAAPRNRSKPTPVVDAPAPIAPPPAAATTSPSGDSSDDSGSDSSSDSEHEIRQEVHHHNRDSDDDEGDDSEEEAKPAAKKPKKTAAPTPLVKAVAPSKETKHKKRKA